MGTLIRQRKIARTIAEFLASLPPLKNSLYLLWPILVATGGYAWVHMLHIPGGDRGLGSQIVEHENVVNHLVNSAISCCGIQHPHPVQDACSHCLL